MLDTSFRSVYHAPRNGRPRPSPAEAYAPYAERASPDVRAQSQDGLIRWLALLICFLLEPLKAIRLYRYGRLVASWGHHRPDLPPGSAQAEAAWVRSKIPYQARHGTRVQCVRSTDFSPAICVTLGTSESPMPMGASCRGRLLRFARNGAADRLLSDCASIELRAQSPAAGAAAAAVVGTGAAAGR